MCTGASTTAGDSVMPLHFEFEYEDESEHDYEEEMIQRRKNTIRSTWKAIEFGLDVKATKIFYDRLFDQFPCVRPMFADDMQSQYKKLYAAVSLAVKCLESDEGMATLIPVLQDLGVRHAGFGVVRAHYEAVTECFLWTLNTYITSQMPMNLSIMYAADVADAWEWVLTLIGKVMADAADEAIAKRKAKQQQQKHEDQQAA